MNEARDVVIIGAGVIGAATAYELTKRGYRTVNVDKLPSPAFGPTSNSCAIVRAHYSTLQGVSMAYAGFRYWQDWTRYVDGDAEDHLARYVQCGTLLLKNASGHHEKVLPHYRALGVQHEVWSVDTITRRMPVLNLGAFWPPKRPEDDRFWDRPASQLDGGIYRRSRAT